MTVKLDNSQEAFLAVLTLVAGADQVGSLEERDFLFERVKALSLFDGMSRAQFNKLLGSVTDKVYESLPLEDGSITTAGIDELLTAAKSSLSPVLQKTLAETAKALCGADDLSDQEAALLAQIQAKLT